VVRGKRLLLEPVLPDINDDPLAARRWLKTVPRPWVVDLFSGAGGLSLGLHQAGFNVVAAADTDVAALETHAASLGGLTWERSLEEPEPFLAFLAERGIRRADVVAGGPPCQPFSRAGAAKIRSLVNDGVRTSGDERVELWRSFVTVVDRLTPRVVLLENVPDMAGWDEGALLLDIMQALRELGYDSEPRVLEAHQYGVPQHRARLFVVGLRSGRFRWPNRRPRVTVQDAIGDLPVVGGDQRSEELSYDGPKTPFQRRARRGVYTAERKLIFDHCTRAVREDDARAYALLGEGQTYRDLPSELQRYRADIFDDKYKRLAWNDVSRTITAHIAKDAYWYIHPRENRTLSIREAARLQTFPDWFRFAGHPTTQLRQIGNAVPPALAYALGLRLRAAIGSRTRPRQSRFAADLLAWHSSNGRWEPDVPDAGFAWPLLVSAVCLSLRNHEQSKSRLRRLLVIAGDPESAVRYEGALRDELQIMGLSQRAGKLLELARVLVRDHDGEVPSDYPALRALPGVTDNAASVVRSFAFGGRSVVLNAGTRRIAERVTGAGKLGSWNARLGLYRLSGAGGPTAAFNHAMRALADEVCVAGAPRCGVCPVASECSSSAPAGKQRQSRSGPTTGAAAPAFRNAA
jgi:DNA (cytosine-5)-methyltransferase 1